MTTALWIAPLLARSSLFTGLVVIVSTVPHAFFGFLAGPVADAYGRRRTLVACDLVRMTAIALMPVLIGIGLPVATVFACVLVAACASALFAPTKAALLPELLAADSLARGNAFVQLSDRVIEIGGKAVAGVLFLLIGPLVFAIDALTFLLSALLLSRVVAAE